MRRTPLWFPFALTLVGITSNALVTPALPNVLAEFSASEATSGFIVASGSVAGIFVAPIVGIAADRIGRRPVIVACLCMFGIFGTAVALAPTLPLLIVARFLQGVGSAGLLNLAVVLIGDVTSGDRRTKLIGRNSAVLTTGLAVLPLISGGVTQLFDWRVTFTLYSAALPLALVGWFVITPTPSVRIDSVADQLRGAIDAVRHPVNLASIVGATLVFIGIYGLFLTVLPLHLEGEFGLNAAKRGAVLSVPAVTSTLVAFNLGRLRRVRCPSADHRRWRHLCGDLPAARCCGHPGARRHSSPALRRRGGDVRAHPAGGHGVEHPRRASSRSVGRLDLGQPVRSNGGTADRRRTAEGRVHLGRPRARFGSGHRHRDPGGGRPLRPLDRLLGTGRRVVSTG